MPQVLTANLGHILAVPGAEAGLEHFRSTPTLTFEQFRFYLQTEVFSALPDLVSTQEQRTYEEKIDQVGDGHLQIRIETHRFAGSSATRPSWSGGTPCSPPTASRRSGASSACSPRWWRRRRAGSRW
jgi:hypothetical protein